MSFGLSRSSAAFNPALHGTPKSSWEPALADAPLLSLPSSGIVAVKQIFDCESPDSVRRCAVENGLQLLLRMASA